MHCIGTLKVYGEVILEVTQYNTPLAVRQIISHVEYAPLERRGGTLSGPQDLVLNLLHFLLRNLQQRTPLTEDSLPTKDAHLNPSSSFLGQNGWS